MKAKSFFQGLQGKLLVYFLLMALVPLLVVSSISYQKAKTSLQEMSQNMLGDMADGVRGKIETLMGDRYDDIKAWSELHAIKDGLKNNSYKEASDILQDLGKHYDVYKLIMLFDAGGNLVAASDPGIFNDRNTDRNQADRKWFKEAIGGAVVVDDVRFSKTADENVVAFSAPVKNDNGTTIGVITSRVTWKMVDKITDETKDGETGYAYIIDKEGVLIAHPNKDKILKENLTKSDNKELAQIANKMIKGETGAGTYSYEGVQKLVAYLPSKGYGDYKGIGWSYAMVMSEKEIYAPIYTLRNMVLFILALAIVAIVFLALLVARKIAAPLVEGVSFAQAVAAGDLTRTLEVKSNDEVGDLCAALNKMAAGLREMVGKIRGTSMQVASAATEISASSEQLARAAQSQASSAEETSSTMAEMAASIQNVAGNAHALASNVDEVSASISQLGASSEQMAKSSEAMASSVSETSATIEQMTVSIDKVAKNAEDLASSVTETSSTVEQMTVSIDQVAGNSQELQQVVAETASIVEEMAVSIKQVAKNVDEADGVAKQASKEGSAGQQAVNDALAAMKRVADVMEKTAESIINLGKRSEEIGTIVKVIDEIADQTNLLALNAAIEAARAGDAGRGFAVVADEVRKLAERSMSATSEIAQVIKQVQADTGNSVKYGELASREAKASMDLSAIAGGALENIVKSVEKTSNLMSQIAVMASEQASASSQVIRAVERMSQSTSVVANAAREQALGGRQIRTAVERMNHVTQEVTTAAKEQALGSRQIRVAVENMNHVTQQVNVATKEQAISARQIVEAVNGMNTMTQSVANSTAEQKKGGEMVVKAVENISDSARENLSSVEQLSKSAQGLSAQAEDLATLVATFKVQ